MEANQEAPVVSKNFTNFTIDHILNHAGSSEGQSDSYSESFPQNFPWLGCTRFCPPKIPRSQRRQGPQKRQLGRHPRIPFTGQQNHILERKFRESPYLSSQEVIDLSRELNLGDMKVKIWFQNRRARERKEKGALLSQNSQSQNQRRFESQPNVGASQNIYLGTNTHNFAKNEVNFEEVSTLFRNNSMER